MKLVKRCGVLIGVLCVTWMLGSSATALAAAPTITSIGPNQGKVGGGARVTVTGTGFISGSTVKFGSSSAMSVTVESSTKIKTTSPAGSGLVGISVSNTNGTSASTPYAQFGYDPYPSGLWLGLNNNTAKYLGETNFFAQRNIVYDRSFEMVAGEVPSELENGKETEEFEARLKQDSEYGMIPVSTIEYKGYDRKFFQFKSDPEFPQARTKKEEEEGKNTIKGYAEGFVKSAGAILKLTGEKYPGMPVLFEPMNEPWGYTTPQYSGKEYANVIVEVLSRAAAAGIPLSDIYVGAIGWDCTASECGEYCQVQHPKAECVSNDWVPAMYAAQPKLETEIQGWYFHPYGTPTGTEEGDWSAPAFADTLD